MKACGSFACARRMTGDETGTTLVELLVSMAILGIVLTAVYAVVASVQGGFQTQSDRSVNVEQAGLAMQQFEKEIFSAEAMSICANTGCTSTLAAGTTCTSPTTTCYLLVYTQTNASTRELTSPGPTAPFSCVQWRVWQVASSPTQYAVQSRRWQPDWENNPSSLVTGWRDITDPIPTASASFLIPSISAFGGRLVQVSLTLNQQPAAGNKTSPLTMTRQMTGVNILSTSSSSGNPNPCVPPNGAIPP